MAFKTFPCIILAAFLPFLINAQSAPSTPAQTPDSGIHFQHDLSWSAIQAKAKTENKYIFIDCFTTWCGPCRYMSTTIFPLKETGDYFNDKFISIKIQLDTTAKDAANIKAWYKDAHDIAEKYNVRAYPTYLIFAPDGHIVHRLVGSSDAKRFIAGVAKSFDTTKQYYTLLTKYQKGERDSAFLRTAAQGCMDAYDLEHAPAIVNDYLATQTNLYTKQNIEFILESTSKSSDKYFAFIADHITEVDNAWGQPIAKEYLRDIYLREATHAQKGSNTPPDWTALHKKIAAHLPEDADELTTRIKITYYSSKKDWPNFETAIVGYMKTYGARMSVNDLNSVAWDVFQKCPDMTCVSDILDWAVKLKESNEYAAMDTYANILYKLGHKDEAIALETKAMALAVEGDKPGYQATIDKMKKNEKTWD